MRADELVAEFVGDQHFAGMIDVASETATDDFDPHALAEQDFLDEVHSFQFWFDSIEGYLTDRPYGRLETTAEEPIDDQRRERLITTLCNYSVGETAALEGAAGLVQLAPDRNSKIFMATQVADEARHLEVFLKKTKSVRHVYTTYAVGERLTLSVGMLRLLRAWALVRGDPPRARLLAVATDSPEGLSPPDIARVLYGLLPDGA